MARYNPVIKTGLQIQDMRGDENQNQNHNQASTMFDLSRFRVELKALDA